MMLDTQKSLQAEILKILKGESGGMKMVALIVKLVSLKIGWGEEVGDDFASLVEAAIEAHPNLSLFEYDWDMGGGNYRAKHFVATKF